MRQSVRSFLLANDLEQLMNSPARVCKSSKTPIDLFCVNNKHGIVQIVFLKVAFLNYRHGHMNQGL